MQLGSNPPASAAPAPTNQRLPNTSCTRTREVLKQVATVVHLGVAAVLHQVCGHHNLLAHHVCKRQHGAVGVTARQREGGRARGGQG